MAPRKKNDTAASAPKTTVADLDDDDHKKLLFQGKCEYERTLADKKAADAAFKLACKKIKSDLGKRGVAEIKLAIELRNDTGKTDARADIESMLRVMRWFGVPVGMQADLFPSDLRPIDERAFAEGKLQGLNGERQNNPHHHTTQEFARHNEGFAEGQTMLATKGFSKLDPDVAADVKKSAAIGSSRPTFEVH